METEKAIDEQLHLTHLEVIELKSVEKNFDQSLASKTNQLAKLEALEATSHRDILRYEIRLKNEEKALVIEKMLHWQRASEQATVVEHFKALHLQAQDKLRRFQVDVQPIKEEMQRLKVAQNFFLANQQVK